MMTRKLRFHPNLLILSVGVCQQDRLNFVSRNNSKYFALKITKGQNDILITFSESLGEICCHVGGKQC